ncbi:Hypothetical predicted protein [Cloeon dipterum]|uniref:Myosin tail domain-containing protein n=1 Tax=Cloeon dipterum TaxID=197152 RepID=A0A8S1DY88_9INSE|nr:Hypothetical predicted protein [Cloeon dipterum]
MSKEMSQLTSRNTLLKDELDATRREKEKTEQKLSSDLEKLGCAKEKMSNEMSQLTSRNTLLKDELDATRREKEKTEQKLISDLEKLGCAKEKMSNEMSQLTSRNTLLEAQVNKLIKNLEDKLNATRLEKENALLKRKRDLYAFRRTVSHLERIVKEKTIICEEQTAKLKEKHEEVEKLNGRINDLNCEIKQKRINCKEHIAELEEQDEEVEKLDSHIRNLKSEIEQLKKRQKEKEAMIKKVGVGRIELRISEDRLKMVVAIDISSPRSGQSNRLECDHSFGVNSFKMVVGINLSVSQSASERSKPSDSTSHHRKSGQHLR